MSAVGAFYLLTRKHEEYAKVFIRLGVTIGFIASLLMLFPTGDGQGKNIARHQPVTLAAMEGLFQTQERAPIAILGQPDMEKKRLDNPLEIPRALSFLTYQNWSAEVRGLDAFPEHLWPDNVPLLYYSYHVMVGLGTIFIAIYAWAFIQLRRQSLFQSRSTLWMIMLAMPFPYIANTAGWMTTELGRQPWLIYNLMRTSEGISSRVSAGNTLFTLIGFMGMYTVLSILFLYLVYREIDHGPEPSA
jgi:cytochrome d ubiquinol oxidase subunit I